MPAPKTLKVWPNPYHGPVDHEGRPASVLPVEPEGDGTTTFDDRRFVGATLQAKILKKFPVGSAQQTVQDTWFEYGDEPMTVRDTPYYRLALRQGAILAADEATAKAAGLAKFVDPGELLVAARDGAALHLTDVIKHDDHADDHGAKLKEHLFGPMPGAKEARAKLQSETETQEPGAAAESVAKATSPEVPSAFSTRRRATAPEKAGE